MLARLEINRFRCLHHVSVDWDPKLNVIVGANGSGKTSLLEAIFYVGRGRSFRSRRIDKIIEAGQSDFTLYAEILESGLLSGISTGLGVGVSAEGTELRIGGQKANSAAQLSTHLAPHIIDPEVHKLLEEGPNRRRRFMDFGVFHVEPLFLESWFRYHRALKQRNAWLKTTDSAIACPFDNELIESGERLNVLRFDYVERLQPHLENLGVEFLGMPASVRYLRGFNVDMSLGEALERSLERDLRFKTTHIGPHRADISLQVAGVMAKERVSRGQQKLLAAALTLAQLRLIEQDYPGRSVLLLDDPAAELDSSSLAKLMAAAKTVDVQMFVTALDAHPSIGAESGRLFHVERGQVKTA